MRIKDIKTRIIYDTRGEKTIEVNLISDDDLLASASVPSGKSKSSKEPIFLTVENCEQTAKELIESELKKIILENPFELDDILLKIDGTSDKSKLGANLMLALSMAFRRLIAQRRKIPLWKVLREEIGDGNMINDESPIFLMNLINGGAHANNNLSFQEYLIAVDTGDTRQNLEQGILIYKKVKNLYPNAGLGDENGFSFNFENYSKPFSVLRDIIKETGLEQSVKLGVDAAATNFYKNGNYIFDGKTVNSEEIFEIYNSLTREFNLLYVEDPFSEDDFENFSKLTTNYPQVVITGDDLTSTNPELIKTAVEKKSISGIIIKPTQIGTIKETLDAIKIAKENNLKIIVSHRSGETDDNFICHLAVACGAWAVKFGAPAKDRIFKYNEILKIME